MGNALCRDNAAVKRDAQTRKGRSHTSGPVRSGSKAHIGVCAEERNRMALTVGVLGASGDLAKKKTYPALFALFNGGHLPKHVEIVGYARTSMSDDELRDKIRGFLKGDKDEIDDFLDRCTYVSGQYDGDDGYKSLDQHMESCEKNFSKSNRLFYLALPPSVFLLAAEGLDHNCRTKSGWNRVVVEKPFGKDLESSNKLSEDLLRHFDENEIYRIDHYLGKELVQSLTITRFANRVMAPVWNADNIANVQITFKEPFGTEGRGGYFDQFGIIRDIIQNHLMQVMTLVAMEKPKSGDAEHIRDEKVRVLEAIRPVEDADVVLGQYKGYLDDETVPRGSVTPTFALTVLHVDNERWRGVPFIVKAGKALNERKAEVRIQFKHVDGDYFHDAAQNELVFKIQPKESMYLKLLTKEPGLSLDTVQSELDLTYADRYSGVHLPDAYERLILDVLNGDHQHFVRSDELTASWKVFTPLLHRIEKSKKKPLVYEQGTRGPSKADELIQSYGYNRYEGYEYEKSAEGK